MVELTHTATRITPQRATAPRGARRPAPLATVAGMAPDERLPAGVIDPGLDTWLSVVRGVVYATVEDDDYVLTPGDRILIPALDRRRIWNAGDEMARVVAEPRIS